MKYLKKYSFYILLGLFLGYAFYMQNYFEVLAHNGFPVPFNEIMNGAIGIIFLLFISILYDILKKNNSCTSLSKRGHFFIFIFLYSLLFIVQNIHIFSYSEILNNGIWMYILLFGIVLISIFLIFKLIKNKKCNKKSMFQFWGMLVLVYIFILEDPNVIFVPNNFHTTENIKIQSGLKESYQKNSKYCSQEEINSLYLPSKGIENIPFIINGKIIKKFKQNAYYTLCNHGTLSYPILPKFGRDIFTNYMLKTVVADMYLKSYDIQKMKIYEKVKNNESTH